MIKKVVFTNENEESVVMLNLVISFTLIAKEKKFKFNLINRIDDPSLKNLKQDLIHCFDTPYTIKIDIDGNKFIVHNAEFVGELASDILQIEGSVIEWN